MRKGSAHGQKRRCGVESQYSIVYDDEVPEPPLFRDPPLLIVATAIVGIKEEDSDQVYARESDWHLPFQSRVEKILVDTKWCAE